MTIIAEPPAVHYAAAPAEPDEDWRRRGACANSDDPNLWFPTGNTGIHLVQIEDAKAACRACPVLENCRVLMTAMVREYGDSLAGVWAATSEADRTSAKRREQKQRAKDHYNEKRRAAA